MRKPNFDFMLFSDGSRDVEFVGHAKLMTEEEFIETFTFELQYSIDFEGLRKPTIEDIREDTVRFYPKVPEWCGVESDYGCYTYCAKGERGSFPVWVISLEDLEEEKNV